MTHHLSDPASNPTRKPDSDARKQPIENPSYRRDRPVIVTEEMRREIAGAIAEIELEQLAILRKLTPAQRVQQAASMIDAAERVTARRLCEREPDLSYEEALRIVRGDLLAYLIKRAKEQPHP
jgi:hypothetical protein